MIRRLARRALRLSLLLGLAYALAGLATWLFADRLIFQPQPPTYRVDASIRLAEVEPGDSIAVRWLPNPAARYTILYSHGNAEDLGDIQPTLDLLRDAGFAVLAYDYRGYGLSSRRGPTEKSAYADHAAAYRFLIRDLRVPADQVILHGRSLGGGVASELAARCPVSGLILESTFTSAFRTVLPRVFPFDRFDTAARLPRIAVPVLVVHGSADSVVPAAHGRALLTRIRNPAPPLWVRGAGHNDVAVRGGAQYAAALLAFAGRLSTPGAGSPDCGGDPVFQAGPTSANLVSYSLVKR